VGLAAAYSTFYKYNRCYGLFDEQEGGRKWQMHGVLNHVLYINLWSKNVIPRSVGNFNVQFLKNLALYMQGNG